METRTLLIVQNKNQGKSNYQSGVEGRGNATFISLPLNGVLSSLTIPLHVLFLQDRVRNFCRDKAAVK